jgi:hypothetical protein
VTLPKKEEKGYLEIVSGDEGFCIVADSRHAGELAALFLQYGISCERRHNTLSGDEELRFPGDMDRTQVQQVLEGYKQAKGS